MHKNILHILICFLGVSAAAQNEMLYKQVDSTKLYLEIHSPEKMNPNTKYPAIIFFFGGGWKGGDKNHFIEHAKYFAQRGLVCFLADYRTETKHGTTPFESLKDAKSAIRFIRKNAANLNIDQDKIREFNNDDAKRQAWAARTRDFFHSEMNNKLYAQYILEAALLKPFSHSYVWAQDINLDGSVI